LAAGRVVVGTAAVVVAGGGGGVVAVGGAWLIAGDGGLTGSWTTMQWQASKATKEANIEMPTARREELMFG
jgi:hypothetical protein